MTTFFLAFVNDVLPDLHFPEEALAVPPLQSTRRQDCKPCHMYVCRYFNLLEQFGQVRLAKHAICMYVGTSLSLSSLGK